MPIGFDLVVCSKHSLSLSCERAACRMHPCAPRLPPAGPADHHAAWQQHARGARHNRPMTSAGTGLGRRFFCEGQTVLHKKRLVERVSEIQESKKDNTCDLAEFPRSAVTPPLRTQGQKPRPIAYVANNAANFIVVCLTVYVLIRSWLA